MYDEYLMEDRLTTAQAMIHSAENRMLRAALKGRISAEKRRETAQMLRDAARYVETLPTGD